MIIDAYNYSDYKALFRDAIKTKQQGGRGQRTALADFLSCQPTYISHVLSGDYNFSLEQAEAACRYFEFSAEATHYTILLVSHARAGNTHLAAFYAARLFELRERASEVKNAVGKYSVVSPEDRAIYYGDWHHGAIHMLVMTKSNISVDEIAARLRLPTRVVSQSMEFLIKIGLIGVEGTSFRVLESSLHLDKASPEINRHHTNHRLRAVQALLEPGEESVHFSSYISCSKSDLPKVKSRLLQCITDCAAIIKSSESETVAGFNIDLYEI